MDTHTRIFKDDLAKLNRIREESGFKSNAFVIHSLLENQAKKLATFEAVMESNVPIVLTGKPLSGKSTFIKTKVLPSLLGTPVLVIDVQNEYTNLKVVGFDIFSLNFDSFSEHLRFVPNKQSMVAESEIGSLFANLEMKKEQLSKLVIIAEEGQSFKNIPSFVRFLYGSRHIIRKMVVITPQIDAFQGLLTLTVIH
jgi:hypothetical protein